MPSTTWSYPSTRSSLEVPRQEVSPFRSLLFCASLLKAPLYFGVCTQILLLPLTLCSRAIVFEPSWPLACNIKLVLFYLWSCVVITLPWVLDFGRVPYVYDYCTRLDFEGVTDNQT